MFRAVRLFPIIFRQLRKLPTTHGTPLLRNYSSSNIPIPPTSANYPLSTMVEDYWQNISTYVYEPGFPLFPPAMGANQLVKDTASMRRLFTQAVAPRQKGQGDLQPSVVVQHCCSLYKGLDEGGKEEFFKILAREFGVSREPSINSAKSYIDAVTIDKGSAAALRAEQILRHAMIPLHDRFFDRVNRLPGGMKFLIDMRVDLLSLIAKHRTLADPHISALSDALRNKLQEWLIGFLTLERITWNSPAIVLEKISHYEAVHAVLDWQDLKRRVGPGRRVFGFFFRHMPVEPLVFLQVALVPEMSTNVQAILNDSTPRWMSKDTARCAVFYSITTQRGLSGIDLGAFLIKRVVRDLQNEFPKCETFCTLSPIPGFRKWLAGDGTALAKSEVDALGGVAGVTGETLMELLATNEWTQKPEVAAALKPILLRLCARYLLKEKRGHLAMDPVANFHLRNGACAHQLNWMADTSDKGLAESFGIMVNYNYLPRYIECNNEQYLHDGTIAVSEGVGAETMNEGTEWLRTCVGEKVKVVG